MRDPQRRDARRRAFAPLLVAAACGLAFTAAAQDRDPFDALRSATGTPGLVPARALAVIPERHTDRALRMADVLERVEPQFDEAARAFGLDGRRAIQLYTREANVPIFLRKTDATIATVLSLELGSRVEVRGVLREHLGRYFLLASDVRPARSDR